MTRKKHRGNPQGRAKAKPITLAAVPEWDSGAKGPANQDRLRIEPATDFDPATGRETPNPNGVKRRRRDTWVRIYGGKTDGLAPEHVAAAEKLRMAAEGMRERDPLSAMRIDRRSGQSDPEAARVDSRRYFRELWAMVPQASRPVVERVVLDDQPIWRGSNSVVHDRHMQRLRDGLAAIR